jgi:hypothetical protein
MRNSHPSRRRSVRVQGALSHLMEDVRSTREPLVKPVAKLAPADDPKREFFGSLKGIIRIVGDIESPAVPTEDWETSR